MGKYVLNSCCGCMELRSGAATLGIIMVILKVFRLVEIAFLIFMSLLLHAFSEKMPASTETMFAMPVICAIVVVMQLVFLIMFIVRLFKNHIDNIGALYTANAVCFAIECIAVAIFLITLMVEEDSSLEMQIGFFVGDVFATVLNLYFILLFRSWLIKENEDAPPPPKNADLITIPFLRL